MQAPSLTFWLAAAAMVAVALAFVLPRLLGRRAAPRGPSRQALNAAVYRAELADLERERAAGTLAPADYDRARAELERRVLDDVQPDEEAAPASHPRLAAVTVGLLLPALAVALYAALGTPSAVGIAAEPSAQPQAAEPAAFRDQLVAHLKAAPRDGRAWVALARLDMSEDRFDDAAAHFARAIEASPKIERDAGVLCEYADALGMAQGGRLEGRPAQLVARALALDPDHPVALELAGSEAYERRDFRAAAQHWRRLLARMPSGTPEHAELAAAVARAERQAALTLPPDGAGARGS